MGGHIADCEGPHTVSRTIEKLSTKTRIKDITGSIHLSRYKKRGTQEFVTEQCKKSGSIT